MPVLIPITSVDDPRIAPYCALRDRDVLGHGAYFIAEGEVVLNVLIERSSLALASLFIAENRLAKLAPLIAKAAQDVPLYIAPQALMDQIAGFALHRGILGLGHRPMECSEAEILNNLTALPEGVPIIACIGIANHDNIGGIFRNAAAFGAGAVLLDSTCVDPLYRKAIRVSVGGALKVPFYQLGSGLSMIDLAQKAGFTPLALSPSADDELGSMPLPARPALVLGTEGPGLPREIMDHCRKVRIAMAADFDSLNVATTSGIALYLATRKFNS